MQTLSSMTDLAARGARISLAVGFFDGVHRGHRRVLTAAIARARALGGEAWALSFTPHPMKVLHPDEAPTPLTDSATREALLRDLGLDGLVVLPFTHELAELSPQAFVEHTLLQGEWAPEIIFSGDNWRFGKNGAGSLSDIPALSHGRIRVRSLSPLLDAGEPVSSTRIRTALAAGDLSLATRLLGRPLRFTSTVVHGRGIGRTLSAATANLSLSPDDTASLRLGVYAATLRLDSPPSPPLSAVVNIGVRPTFQDAASGSLSVEAHLLHFQGDLYGKKVELELREFLRDEHPFATPDALAAQIQQDVAAAESLLAPANSLSHGASTETWTFHPSANRPALEAWIAAGGIAQGGRLLQDGRNRTVLVEGIAGVGDLVIKHFGAQSALKDYIARRGAGSKAMRAYRAAAYLYDWGIPTPVPLGVMERWEGGRLHESILLTQAVSNLRSFRRELADLYAVWGPCEVLMERLRVIAEFCADLHDAGFFHRDLGNQNLFFAESEVLTLDLNRGRCRGRPLSLAERARDLSRIDLPSDLLRVFLEMYWRGDIPPKAFLHAEHKERRRYALHCATRTLRHPFRARPKGPSPEGDYPSPRDFWIWDERSVQAISAFKSRDRHRYQQPGRVWKTLCAIGSAFGFHGLRGRYHRLRETSFSTPIEGFGERLTIALTARPDSLEKEISLLRELGAHNVLLRLYAHERSELQHFTLKAARRLHREGFGVALALVQCRASLTHPETWEALGHLALRETADFVRWVEVGHAINRVKWGLWGYPDVRRLFAPLAQWRKAFPKVVFTGPSVIDFEPDFTLTALREAGVSFDVLSQHLYVDRRGPPEGKQNGFDAVEKMAFLRAEGEVFGGFHGSPLIVSEFNWPLVGQGVYSPVGSPYVSPGPRTNDPSVTEEEAAAYLIRYALLGLASGHAREMVFWRFDAKGFGAIDGEHHRPAFDALKTWYSRLNGAHFLRKESSVEGHISLHFQDREGHPLILTWDPATNAMPTLNLCGHTEPAHRGF